MEECKYIIKEKKMENLINEDSNLSSSDNESDNKFDNKSDNDENFSSFLSTIYIKKMEIKKIKDSLIDLRTTSEVMKKTEISER